MLCTGYPLTETTLYYIIILSFCSNLEPRFGPLCWKTVSSCGIYAVNLERLQFEKKSKVIPDIFDDT